MLTTAEETGERLHPASSGLQSAFDLHGGAKMETQNSKTEYADAWHSGHNKTQMSQKLRLAK